MKWQIITALVGFLMVIVSPAAAQDFQPYTGSSTDAAAQVSAPLFVVLAYSAIWLVLLFFVASIWRRQRRVEAELARVSERLGEGR